MKNRSLKQRLVCAVLALVMMVTSLLGTTFAWFTDEVTSAGNKIESGSLKIDLLHKDGEDWVSVKDNPEHKIFDYDKWEPGFTNVETLKIANLGSLALQYRLSIEVADGTAATGKNGEDLADVIDVYVAYGDSTESSLNDITAGGVWVCKGTLSEVMKNPASFIGGQLLPTGEVLGEDAASTTQVGSQIVKIALHMQESAGNEYQKLSVGDIYVNLIATQWGYEDDSFGNDYDNGATFPTFSGDYVATAPVEVNGDNTVKNDVTLSSKEAEVSATVPSGTLLEAGVNNVTLTVSSLKNSDSNIEVSENQVLNAVDVHVSGIAAGNTAPILVTVKELLAKGLNMGNYELYHVENGTTVAMTYVATTAELDAHNEFTYDPATGDVVMALCSFSEIALLIADTANPWNGDFDYEWYDANESYYEIANADQLAAFGAIVGGMNGYTADSFKDKTVKLLADINLGDKESENSPDIIFYPIGYYFNENYTFEDGKTGVYSTVYSFEGTFDGNGNTIANFYQNTWEMKGDYNDGYPADSNYYKDAMGLFGYVVDGTVKNLTVDNFSSDGEFTPTGVIAAYSVNSTFENIAITNCNPRVYNTGNGGIIGIAGNSGDQGTKITLKNITVDNSNKISALWGSWDVACGGLVGMFRGNADGGTGEIEFVNCHVAAQIDVYNDVCANYQYYAYRYAGMIIGSVRHNTTNDEGRIIPNMTGISATDCTVNYGDWNDYYYCEFEKNSMASYSEDYQFSRVPHSELDFTDSNGNGVVDADERASVKGCKHEHTAEENHQAIYLPFHQLFTGYSWGVSSIGLEKYSGIVTNLDIHEGDQEASVVKFESKFTGDFLYRVGNKNTVSLGSLFAAADGVTISDAGVWVKVEKLDEAMNVSGTFTANTTDWTQGKIQFSGTGVVKVTIQDYNFCKPTEIILEVVDAQNATTATSATKNNVVLLNDVGLHTIEVSNGYTLYGNGFKMEAKSDVMYDAMGAGFVVLRNGTLDNVQIICPNFSHSIIYTKNITESGNQHAASSDSSSDAYGNVRSAVMADGNSKIVNSYVHGGRAAIFLRSGNLLIDNSTISGGAAANIHTMSAQSLTLRDATLIQKPFQATVHDTSKTLMGFSVLLECDESGNATPVVLEGTLIQNAWINEDYKQYIPSDASSIVQNALEKTEYLHDLDGDGEKESLNLGFTYIPQNLGGATNANVTDNRTDKNSIPYEAVDVGSSLASAKVYSYKSANGTSADFIEDNVFVPEQGTVAPSITFTDSDANRVFETKFDGSDNRWESSLTVNLDNGNYTFNFDTLLIQKHGKTLSYTVKTNAGSVVDTAKAISLTTSGVTEYIITTVDSDGITHTIYFILTATRTSIPEPVKTADPDGTHYLVVKSKGSDWSCAINALDGATIEYYTANGEKQTLALSSLVTSSNKGKLNGTNNYWTITKDGYTLKITCGYIHDTKQVYGMPVAVDGKLYFTISSTNGYVSTSTSGRTVTLTYEFTDPNGKTLTFSKTWQFNYADYKSGTQYSYSDFVDGTLKEASSGGGCVTGDTLVTLADGSKKQARDLTAQDILLVWDFYTGEYATVPATLVINHGEGIWNVISLTFDDGSTLDVVSAHAFFDADVNEFVMIDNQNVADYLGHSFIKCANGEYTTVKLVDYSVEQKLTDSYSLVSTYHYNFIVEDMLSLTNLVPALTAGLEIGENMMYDAEILAADIERYGLYTYDDFADYMTEEQFYAFNGEYLKISVGKGYITYEGIIDLILGFVNP